MDWKAFQDLVGRIEKIAADREAVVTSPDRLRDYVTGGTREVDATIRQRVGTAEVLIVVEARKHSDTQDVTWIEQLATKRDSLRASLLIAVSSSGFSHTAVALAEAKGIALRTLSLLDDTAIASLLTPIFHVTPHLDIHAIGLKPWGGDSILGASDAAAGLQPALDTQGADARFMRVVASGELISANDIFRWAIADQPTRPFDDCPEDGTPVLKTFTIVIPNNTIAMDTERGVVMIETVYLRATIYVTRALVPPDIAMRYHVIGGNELRHSEFEVPDASGGTRLTIQDSDDLDTPRLHVEVRDRNGVLHPARLELLRKGRMVDGRMVEDPPE